MFKKCLIYFMTLAIVIGVLPTQVYAEEEPEYLSVEEGIEDYLEDGSFYFGSQNAEFPENATHGYLLKVARKGNGEGEAKVRVTFTDYSAKYGTDYKIEVYQSKAKEKAQNTEESLSVAEAISEADDAVVTDSTDDIVSGEDPNAADPTADTESEDVDTEEIVENYENLTEEENENLDSFVNSFYEIFDIDTTASGTVNDAEETEKTEEVEENPLQTSELAKARSEATGLASDKEAMETGNASLDEQLNEVLMSQLANEKIVSEISNELNSVYVDLEFADGETEKYIEFIMKDNSISDGDRFFTANLTNVPDTEDTVTISDLSGFQAKIVDDEEGVPSTVSFSDATYYPEEGYVKVTLVREGSVSDLATVNLSTSDGSAISGQDYSEVNATVSFLYGLNERTVNIPVRSDYLEDDTATFNLTIDSPVNCDIGTGTATAVISKDDASYLFEDNSLNSESELSLASVNDNVPSKVDTVSTSNHGQVRVGDETNFPHVTHVDYSSAFSYSKLIDDHLELHVENGGNAWHYEVNGHSDCLVAQARVDGFNSTSDKYENLPRYDYDGIVVDWEKSATRPSWNGTYVGFNGNNSFDAYDWVTTDERWDRKNTAIYTNNICMYAYNFGTYKWLGFGPTVKIYKVRPILRAFNVKLLQATPLEFVDKDGTLKPSTQIAELRNISETYLNNSNSSAVSTLYSGDSITVELKNKDYNPVYLKGIAIVNDKGEEKVLVDNLSENTDSYSIQLNNDLLYENQDYITYKKTSVGGQEGSFSIKPILGYKDLEVKIDNSDKRGYVEALDCSSEPTKDGNTVTYHYHRGDYVLLKQYLYDEYKGVYKQNSITIKPSQNSARDQSFNTGTNGYGERYINETKLEIKPNFVDINSNLVVRVKKSEVDAFKTYQYGKGEATLKTVLDYPKLSEDSEYVVYSIADKNSFVANKYYELYADTKDSSYVPVWSIDTSSDCYAQNSFALQGNIAGTSTVVNLTLQKADTTSYAITANISYSEPRIGNVETKVGWYKASGVVLSTGYNEKQTSITDTNGDVVVGPIKTINGYRVQYKMNYSGKAEYSSILVDNTNASTVTAEGESCTEIKLNNLVISTNNTNVPYISSFVATRSSGAETISTNEIVIDGKEAILNAYISNDGAVYLDDEGKEHVETVKKVEFFVYDGVTHDEKFALGEGTKTDENTWTLSYVFNTGESMKYEPSDIIFARVTTDRIVGKGGIYDFDGNYAEKTYLKETVYSAVNTGYVFSQNDYVKPAEQNLRYKTNIEVADLPYIGRINMDCDIGKLRFSMTKIEDGGMRFSIGYIPKTFGNNVTKEGFISDTGEVIDKTNFKDSFNDMATTIRESSATLNEKSTFFAPTVIQARPFIGFYIDFKYTFVQDDEREGNVRKVLSCAGGGAFIGGSMDVRKAFYMLIGYVPVYIGGDVSAGILLELGMRKQYASNLTYDQMLNDNAIDEDFFDFRLRAYAYMSLYVGAGVCGTIGVRGGLNYYPMFIWSPTITETHPNYHVLGYTHKFYLKLWADAVFFSMPIGSVNLSDWDVDVGYFDDINKDAERAEDGELIKTTSLSNEETEVKAVAETSEWLGDESDLNLRASWGEPSTKTLSESGYDNNYQQLIDIGNNRIMMVFVDAREDNNYPLEQTVLKYSIYNENDKTWSTPVVIDHDGTAALYPSVCKTGENKVTVTWMSHEANTEFQKTKEEIDALSADDYSALQKSYLQAQDIYTIDIDTETLVASNKQRITSDSYFNSTPMITYDSSSGTMLVYYYKADVTNNFVTSVNPTQNGATLAFMLYDATSKTWKQVTINGVTQEVNEISEFTDSMNGQSFVPLYTEQHQDPVIYDLDVTTFNGKGYYAYTVDEDNNLQTSSDRHLYLGIYDFSAHKFIYNGRVTKSNDLGETSPKFAVNNDTCYLFWNNETGQINYKAIDTTKNPETSVTFLYEIQNNGKEIKFDNGKESGSGVFEATFSYGSIFSASDIPTITGYEPFVDKHGDLYVAFTQNVRSNNDQTTAFNAEVFVTAMVNSGAGNVCWSGAVQLTDSGVFNETPAIAATSDNHLVLVNSQYSFSSKTASAEITDKKLVSTEFTIVPSLEVENLSYVINTNNDTTLPKANDEVRLAVTLKNGGVMAASGYKVEITPVYDNQPLSTGKITIENKQGKLLPSSSTVLAEYANGDPITYTIPDSVEDILKFRFDVTTTEYDSNGKQIGRATSESFTPFKCDREYEISDIETEITNNAIYLEGTLKNTGNVVTGDLDTIKVSFNDYYFESGKYTLFGDEQVEELQPGETQKFKIQLDIDDSYFKYGSVNINVGVMNEEEEMFEGSVNTLVQLETPYKITVNDNDFSKSNYFGQMTVGDTLELNGTYSSKDYFGGGTLTYASLDTSVVTVEGNRLKAVGAGEAIVAVKVYPYGGYQEMVVRVVDKKHSDSNTDKSSTVVVEATPTPTVTAGCPTGTYWNEATNTCVAKTSAVKATATPSATSTPNPTASIEPTKTPEATASAEPTIEPEVVSEGSWALMNLVATVVTALLALFLVLSKSDSNDTTSARKQQTIWKIVSVVDAILAIVVFILTENMKFTMTLVDKWSILMVVLVVISVISLVLGKKYHDEDE